MIGGVVDLNLLSCSPKFGQESSEGSGGIELSKCCNNGGERENELSPKFGEEALFIVPPKIEPLGAKRGKKRSCREPGLETNTSDRGNNSSDR